jgi:hypothetical protein
MNKIEILVRKTLEKCDRDGYTTDGSYAAQAVVAALSEAGLLRTPVMSDAEATHVLR